VGDDAIVHRRSFFFLVIAGAAGNAFVLGCAFIVPVGHDRAADGVVGRVRPEGIGRGYRNHAGRLGFGHELRSRGLCRGARLLIGSRLVGFYRCRFDGGLGRRLCRGARWRRWRGGRGVHVGIAFGCSGLRRPEAGENAALSESAAHGGAGAVVGILAALGRVGWIQLVAVRCQRGQSREQRSEDADVGDRLLQLEVHGLSSHSPVLSGLCRPLQVARRREMVLVRLAAGQRPRNDDEAAVASDRLSLRII
jgi:hypothetical protein